MRAVRRAPSFSRQTANIATQSYSPARLQGHL